MPKLTAYGEYDKSQTFRLNWLVEVAAANPTVTTSYAETDTPVSFFIPEGDFENLREGKITRVKIRLNFANAVTYKLRIWRASAAGDMESDSNLLYFSGDNLPANLADNMAYDDKDLNIDFSLAERGKMYFGVEWSGAPGDTSSYIMVIGERKD